MALQHLRSSTANKRPLPAGMSDGQLAINTNNTSPGVFFKNSAGALVKVGPVHVGATAPNASPASGETGNTVGEQWLDTSGTNPVLKIWDGSAWQSEAGEFVNVSGDTMTGALVMDNQQQVRFRETTANGTNYVAIQAPASVGADRTLTLPDVSGTIVSTGDTGTVTSTMIADGTIVNGDINASAAIAGTKISPDFGSQTITTTGVVSAAAGAAGTPSITFTGDLNTGIYSPGADQVAISTGGSGRLFVNAGGDVGVRSAAVGFPLEVRSRSTTDSAQVGLTALNWSTNYSSTYLQLFDTAATGSTFGISNANSGQLVFQNHANAIIGTNNATPIIFATQSSERLRITSAGLVGVGTSSPGTYLDTRGFASYRGNAYTIASFCANNTLAPLNICQSENGTHPAISAGQTSTGTYQPLVLMTSEQKRMIIDATGNVGIGTTSPSYLLDVAGNARIGAATGDAVIEIGGGATGNRNAIIDLIGDTTYADYGLRLRRGDTGANTNSELIHRGTGTLQINAYDVAPIAFLTGNAERARIDSSGRLLVGTSSVLSPIGSIKHEIAGGNLALSSFAASAFAFQLGFTKSRSTSSIGTIVQSGDELGNIVWWGDDGTSTAKSAAGIQAYVDGTPGANDMPGRLVFSTTADGASSPTERMRITNDGKLYFACTADPSSTIKGGAYIGSAASPYFSSSAGTSTSTYTHFYFINGNGTVGSISTSGSATAYNTSSDYRLKENVTVVTDGITRLQQLKPSRFNFIADPAKTVDGFIAHEVQSVVPEAITGEKDAVDDDGNPIYQGIDQSKLVPLLTAALQEAITKIESLEARLTAAGL